MILLYCKISIKAMEHRDVEVKKRSGKNSPARAFNES